MDSDLMLEDGHATLIGFALEPTLKVYEKEVTPPGMSGGGAINTTTMRNTAYRTNAPKQLKTLSNVSVTAGFASSAIPALQDMIQQKQLITLTFPDGATLAFYGWLDEFQPSSFGEGTMPTASMVIHPTNRNPETGEEIAPVYTPTPEGT